MPYKDACKKLQEWLEPHLNEYKFIIHTKSADDLVKQKYYSLYINLVWYFDLTRVEHFGDGENKSTGNYTMFILDCAS